MLHIVNKSPLEGNALDACLRVAKPGSVILLIEDGVYATAKEIAVEDRMRRALDRFSVYALGPDLDARGIARARLIDGVGVVDYGGFVDLAVRHHPVQSWL